MNKFIYAIVLILFSHFSFSQEVVVSSKSLTEQESQQIIDASVKTKFGITFPIFRVYEFNDKTGTNYLVLTERDYLKDSLKVKNDTIKAYLFNVKSNKLILQNTIKDFIYPNKAEKNIWFFTKYLQLNDIDGDGIIEPIIVYGTLAANGLEDGRVKIITVYKNKKSAIRHQSGTLDFERGLQLDKTFYQLPAAIQTEVTSLMEKMSNQNSIIFPAGWQKGFSEKKTVIKE